MAAIALHDLTLGYDGHPAVHHLSGVFAAGSMTAVVGPNGSGKSTLLKGITGILRPLGGRIERGGLRISQIAYLPQQAEIDRSFPITVLDLVALGLWKRLGMFGGMRKELWGEARQALTSVGLDGFELRAIGELSAGQFQRVLFARLLLQDCPVILLDEPFTGIDTRTTADSLRGGAALARREPDDYRGAAQLRSGALPFPQDLDDRPGAHRLGRHRGGSESGEFAARPTDVRGLGRSGGGLPSGADL